MKLIILLVKIIFFLRNFFFSNKRKKMKLIEINLKKFALSPIINDTKIPNKINSDKIRLFLVRLKKVT